MTKLQILLIGDFARRELEGHIARDQLERAHGREIIRQKLGIGFHHGLEAQGPVDQPVLDGNVGPEVFSPELGSA